MKRDPLPTPCVLSHRSVEFELFADHQRLISDPIRDVVPVANGNASIMKCKRHDLRLDCLANKMIEELLHQGE